MNIALKPSKHLLLLLIATHAAAVIIIWLVQLPGWLQAAATLVLCLSLFFYSKRYAMLSALNSIIGIEIREERVCIIQTRDGKYLDCIILPTSTVYSWLTVLNLMQRDERVLRHVVIFPDAIATEDFRQLRVWLRWKYQAQPSPSA
ncbi:MAG: protein YgfX [Burkholderiales bacterium]